MNKNWIYTKPLRDYAWEEEWLWQNPKQVKKAVSRWYLMPSYFYVKTDMKRKKYYFARWFARPEYILEKVINWCFTRHQTKRMRANILRLLQRLLWQYGISVVDEYRQHTYKSITDAIDIEPLSWQDMDRLGYKMSDKQAVYEGLLKPFDIDTEVDYDWLTKQEYMEKNKLIRPTYLDDIE